MNILITGGAGYIGTTLTTQLLNAGHKVTVYDSFLP
jgi:UDP-glucose 4-epimerase